MLFRYARVGMTEDRRDNTHRRASHCQHASERVAQAVKRDGRLDERVAAGSC